MKWIFVGLGNPGEEYVKTRHNTGRIVLEDIRVVENFSEWEKNKTYDALVSTGEIEDREVILLQPETFMNSSGRSVMKVVKSKKAREQSVVIYDDIDLPIGTWKISYNRSSGGHNGVESIATTLQSKEFARIRIGIAPVSGVGVIVKPYGDDAVAKFVLGKFREEELDLIHKQSSEILSALHTLIKDGLERAMNKYN